MKRSPITTHILDTSVGKPAEGVEVLLYQKQGEIWKDIANGTTNSDGRIENLLDPEKKLPPATYKINFFPLDYFQREKRECFYPMISICFEVKNSDQHYHVPLLLNGFGYSTYRGS